MKWVVLEEMTDEGARLTALQLENGDQRVLYRTDQRLALRPAVHPGGARVALDAASRNALRGANRARVGVVNLESGGIGWLRQSLDPRWRLSRATFDPEGQRMALLGAYDQAPVPDLYVLEVTFRGNSIREEVIGGASNPRGFGLASPTFLPGGEQILYLQASGPGGGGDGAWELAVLDLTRPGTSAARMDGRAPSCESFVITEGADAVPENGLWWCAPLERAYFVTWNRAEGRQRLRYTGLDDSGLHDLGKPYLRIEEFCVAPGGELVAFSADGHLWLADGETGAALPIVEGDTEQRHRGLAFDLEEGRLLFCTSDDRGARVRSVSLADRTITDLHALGEGVSVVSMMPVPHQEALDRLPESEVVAQSAQAAPGYKWATAIQRVAQQRTGEGAGFGSSQDMRAPLLRPVPVAPKTAPRRPPSVQATQALASLSIDEGSTTDHPGRAALEAIAADQGGPGRSRTRDTALLAAPVEQVGNEAGHEATATLARGPDPAAPPATGSRTVPGAGATMMGVPLPQVVAQAVAQREAEARQTLETPRAPDPAEDFEAWLTHLADQEDPGSALAGLATRIGDQAISQAAAQTAGARVEALASGADAVTETIFALSAVAHLKAEPAVPLLTELCETAARRLEQSDALPEVEEHFAIAALRHLKGHLEAFGAMEVYGQYEAMLEEGAALLEDQGEEAALALMEATATAYREVLSETLGRSVAGPTRVQPAAEAAQLAAQSAPEPAHTEPAHAETPTPTAPTPAAPMADPAAQAQAEADQAEAEWAAARARAEEAAAEQAAWTKARAAAEQAAQARAEAEAEEARARAEAARRVAESEAEAARQAAEAARARAEAELRKAESAMQAAAVAQEKAQRLTGEFFPPSAEQLALAETPAMAASPQAVTAQAVAAPATPAPVAQAAPAVTTPHPAQDQARKSTQDWTPLSSTPAAPVVRPVRATPQPITRRVEAAPAPEASDPLDALQGSADDSLDLPATAMGVGRKPPGFLPIVGLMAILGGLAQALIGLKLGGLMVPLGGVTLVAGIGIFGDRRWGWLAGLSVLATDALYLGWFGATAAPIWLPGPALFAGAVLAVGMMAMLLHPAVRQRYDPRKRRF